MKNKTVALFLILIGISSGCAPASAPAVDDFEFGERCPRVCWLGIQPGLTTYQETLSRLDTSNRIEKIVPFPSEDGLIRVKWYTTRIPGDSEAYVYVSFGGGVVQEISFAMLYPFTVGDFIDLIGEPDGISIRVIDAPDDHYVMYKVYYTSLGILLSANPAGHITAPSGDDRVEWLTLNTEYSAADIQPWLGYGHLNDYLPGVESP